MICDTCQRETARYVVRTCGHHCCNRCVDPCVTIKPLDLTIIVQPNAQDKVISAREHLGIEGLAKQIGGWARG